MAPIQKKSFADTVAERLIEQLRTGTAPWQRPWKPGDPMAMLPANPLTGKRYRGINALYLMSQGRADPRWMTYKQADSVGAQVRKGERGTSVQYWKFSEERNRLDGSGSPVSDASGNPIKETVMLERPRVFFATVFNAEQIDGLPPRQQTGQSWADIARAEQILMASGATVVHQPGDRAFYRPSTDSITLPDRGQFESADRYYAVALHELGHWTGHPSRLDRDLAHPFGSEGYAKEELRAEIASMMLGEELNLGRDVGQHAAYVQSWIKVLQEDPLEIFRAAADAEKIREFVLALEQKQVLQQEPVTYSVGAPTASLVEGTVVMTHLQQQSKSGSHVAVDTADTDRIDADHSKTERVYIDVPFREKDAAKALGARWDRRQQAWYVPSGMAYSVFSRWPRLERTNSGAARSSVESKALSEPSAISSQQGSARIYLAVPYAERAVAKAAGALWDKAAKSWFAGAGADMTVLGRWLPERFAAEQMPAMAPRDEFASVLRDMGFLLTGDEPVMDGRKHRATVAGDKPGEKAGFYVGHLDGHPAGYIKNNRTGEELRWKSKGYSLESVDRAQLHADALAKSAQRSAELEQMHAATAQRLQDSLKALMPATCAVPYLSTKGIKAFDGVLTDRDGKTLYVPAFDASGKLWTVQYIQEDGTKRFAKDARKEGCFHVVGGLNALAKAPVLVIAEGYATAATLAEALGHATVAAFDSGNLEAVVKALHERYPAKPVIVAGDDDRHLMLTQGVNPGRSKAESAANAVGGAAVFPIFVGEGAVYPSHLPAITPEAFRAHERAIFRLSQIGVEGQGGDTSGTNGLTDLLLSEGQLEALAAMKKCTDFNDLHRREGFGIQAVKRHMEGGVGVVLAEIRDRIERARTVRVLG